MQILILCKRRISCKKGSQMVEGAISLPLVILAVMLLIRLFVFYLNIIDTSVCEHISVLRSNDRYKGKISFKTYNDSAEIMMLRGGLLKFDLSKEIKIKQYLINEDAAVRLCEKVKDFGN